MKLFRYKGISVVIMLRDEHCPPHAHVDGGSWSARFTFSFWHNSVELWDVVAHAKRPPTAMLEGLRHALRQPAHLRRARSIWWDKLRTVCLNRKIWDWQTNEVVVVHKIASTTCMIHSACYEPETNKTLLALMGIPEGVEIQL
jgi:hypothetical protein